MTNITDEDLARMLEYYRNVTSRAREDVPALIAALREARAALEPFAALARAADWKNQLRNAVVPFKEKWQNTRTGEEAVLTWQDFGRADSILEKAKEATP